jgi:hypothetical protein
MNCDQVVSHLTELARREPMESGLQADCQLHLVACEECRERLAEVEFLQRTLWLVARAERRQEAAPAVEQRLLAALQQEREAAAARNNRSQNISWWSSRLLWRSAAVLLLAAGLALTLWALTFRELTFWGWTRRQAETRSTPGLVAESSPPVAPAPGSAVARAVTGTVAEPRRSRGPERRRTVRSSRATAPTPVRPSSVTTAAAGADVETEEALTDYLLLNPGQRFYPLERGQLIRVMVPRSTLGSFGFPVNPERAMTPVKADLVVGEDGMARAIRFIK